MLVMGTPWEEFGLVERLGGRMALITGAARGLGEAIARAFAAEGASLLLADRDAAAVQATAADLGAIGVPADVSREDDVIALMATCEKAFGRLDILVNTAGVGGPVGPVEALDVAAWDATYAVNVRGVLACIKHGVPLLRAGGRGVILNMASRAGFTGLAEQAAYSGSKFAVLGITEAVARELGPEGIRVNALCPGVVETDFFRRNATLRAERKGGTTEDDRAAIADATALGRLTSREDVAALALFLASDESRGLTATPVTIDSGRR